MIPAWLLFWPFSALAVLMTAMVLVTRRPVYAVLYLVLSLMSVAVVIYTMGAPVLAVFEVIVYAGAIMVFFLFVVMMLNLGTGATQPDLARPTRKELILPAILSGTIAIGLLACVTAGTAPTGQGFSVQIDDLGRNLFSAHFLGVKLASLVLLVATVGGMHLGAAAAPAGQNVGKINGEGAEDAR